MGGTGGTYNLMGGDSGAAASTDTQAAQMNGLAGSRGALAANPTIDAALGTGPTTQADFNTWMQSVLGMTQGIPTATATNAGNPLIANPTQAAAPEGFQHAAYPEPAAADVGHLGAALPKVEEVAKEFAAPTSFLSPREAAKAAAAKLTNNTLYSQAGWETSNPEAMKLWLQTIADVGGDYRQTDDYYTHPVAYNPSMKIYWPGDPARPK